MIGSENVGMSNRNVSEILTHRKSKVSWAMLIIPGLGGPKASPWRLLCKRNDQSSRVNYQSIFNVLISKLLTKTFRNYKLFENCELEICVRATNAGG